MWTWTWGKQLEFNMFSVRVSPWQRLFHFSAVFMTLARKVCDKIILFNNILKQTCRRSWQLKVGKKQSRNNSHSFVQCQSSGSGSPGVQPAPLSAAKYDWLQDVRCAHQQPPVPCTRQLLIKEPLSAILNAPLCHWKEHLLPPATSVPTFVIILRWLEG